MRYDRDSVSPWAFFLPIALAVMVGNLVSDAIGHALRDRFEDTTIPVVEQVTAPAVATEVAAPVEPLPAPAPAAVVPEPVAPPVAAPHPDAAIVAEPDSASAPLAAMPAADPGVRRLSGPMTARQAGESESCINNTVATRSPNGWEQALENDAPVRCEASSN